MSLFTRNLAVASLVLSATLAPAWAQEPNSETVMATVDGTVITLGHMITMRNSLPEQYQTLPDDVLFTGILDQLIQQAVIAQNLGERDKAARLKFDNEERALSASIVIDKLLAETVTDEALKAAYDEKFAAFEPEREYNASHILVETEDEAKALVIELRGGADFAETARQKSTGPSGPSGGDLGWFGPGMMVKEFEDTVLGMELGTVSEPVQTQFGWHVIRLNDSRLKEAPTLDEVRDELVDVVRDETVQGAIAELMEKATIEKHDATEIDPAILKNADLLKD